MRLNQQAGRSFGGVRCVEPEVSTTSAWLRDARGIVGCDFWQSGQDRGWLRAFGETGKWGAWKVELTSRRRPIVGNVAIEGILASNPWRITWQTNGAQTIGRIA